MGEHIYECEGKLIRFSEDDDISCLCTFPHNDRDEKGKLVIGKDRLISLALLGCAIVLVEYGKEFNNKEYIYLPNDLKEYYKAIKETLKEY